MSGAARPSLGLAGPLPAVVILEPDDVVQLRRRHLEDSSVFDRLQPVHRTGWEAERLPGPDHLFLEDPLPRLAELDPRPALEHVPGLVLLVVELEAERLAGLHEQDLPGVRARVRPDQLGSPRLLDRARIEGEAVDAGQVRGE